MQAARIVEGGSADHADIVARVVAASSFIATISYPSMAGLDGCCETTQLPLMRDNEVNIEVHAESYERTGFKADGDWAVALGGLDGQMPNEEGTTLRSPFELSWGSSNVQQVLSNSHHHHPLPRRSTLYAIIDL